MTAPPRYPRPCRPPWWARGGHAQTLLGHLIPSKGASISRDPRAKRRETRLEDGDRLVSFGIPGTSGVRVHLFHGLSGDADADYMRRTVHALCLRGHGVWATNHRGCGAGRGLARGPYHSGSSADLAAVLEASRTEAPDELHVAVGFSLSGNALLLGAAQQRFPWLTGLLAICPPVDLARTTRDLNRGVSRIYELRFIHRLRRVLAEREEDGLAQRTYRIPRLASLGEFDDLFTAPAGGFASGADYYARCSAGPRLPDVRLPGVILAAADDPFVHPYPWGEVELPPNLLLHLEPRGGHTSFLERRGWGFGRWLDDAIVHYVEALAAGRPSPR